VAERPGKYFSWSEMTTTATGLDNTPGPTERLNIRLFVETVLDPLREARGAPIRVTSGYRSHAVNDAVGGSVRSLHTRGLAADIKSPDLDAHGLLHLLLLADVPFDQVIAYAPERGGHVHIQWKPDNRNRHQKLWAPATGGYEDYEGHFGPITLGYADFD